MNLMLKKKPNFRAKIDVNGIIMLHKIIYE